MSRNGTFATADTGPERFGISIIEPPGKYGWRERHVWARTPRSTAPEVADPDWKSVAAGITFDESGKNIWMSEGHSGRIRQIDASTGDTRRTISLNSADAKDSVTGEMVFDSARRLLYVAEEANSRIVIVDTKTNRVVSSIPTAGKPSALALSPEKNLIWVTTPDSICAINVRDTAKTEPLGCVKTDSPNGIAAVGDRVYISNGRADSITVVDAGKLTTVAEIPLRIPSLENYRGIQPAGLAFDPVTKWLLVAESGINAVGVVDTQRSLLIGHLPAAWMPVRVAISADRVYVVNALGRGTGPSGRQPLLELGEVPSLYHGSVTTFIMPDATEILRHTGTVFTNDGFVPWMHEPAKPPDSVKHVVLIEQEGRTFDEVLGDIAETGNGKVLSLPKLARFGMHGYADGGRTRFSVQDAAITPNYHAIAETWAFSDNFYADEKREGDEWLRHLQSSGITVRQMDDTGLRVIAEFRQIKDLPQFTIIHLKEDRAIPLLYEASSAEENDQAVGQIVAFLSKSQWWPELAVFISASSTQEGMDHIDSHRTILVAAGPHVRRRYVSHTNSSFPGLLRTVFELLHVAPMNLDDVTAASLQDVFTSAANFESYTAQAPDRRIFDPAPQ